MFLNTQLNNRQSLFILDGLDEVRPSHKNFMFEQINAFYNKHFKNNEGARLVVTCRKEAYRDLPLDIPDIWEVRPLSDPQLKRFAKKWPLKFPAGKSSDSFLRELKSASRILELARSPLLLVGGLMQYTESNLGIPEERVEYLARIAKWLVSDWAVAQNHPNDPFRQVYDRLLPRLAYHLHKDERSECPKDEAVVLLSEWLPDFGVQADKAQDVFEGILTKTGILVQDSPTETVFSQFGLQEFFASVHIVNNLTVDDISKLEPKTWWREVILLAIAQLQDPSKALSALFEEMPLLAASAVGECPTPSIDMQKRAVEICLSSIDSSDPSATTAAISLLRKIAPLVETDFLHELEIRLVKEDANASVIATILSTADTASATEVIAKYPQMWVPCLQNIGYLSNSFENLLIDWVANRDDINGELAVNMITSKLTPDRFTQLSNMLPKLEQNRAEQLSVKLLCHLGREEDHPFLLSNNSLLKISRCVAYINNPNSFLKSMKKLSPHMATLNAAITAMFIKTNHDPPKKESYISRILLDCSTLCQRSSSISLWLSSAFCILGMIPCLQTFYTFITLATLLLLFSFFRIPSLPPWLSGVIFSSKYATGIISTLTLICGFTLLLGIGGTLPDSLKIAKSHYVILMSLVFAITGNAFLLLDGYSFFRQRKKRKDILLIISSTWICVLIILFALDLLTKLVILPYLLVASGLFALFHLFIIIRMLINWNITIRARKRMKKIVAMHDLELFGV